MAYLRALVRHSPMIGQRRRKQFIEGIQTLTEAQTRDHRDVNQSLFRVFQSLVI